MNSIELGRLSMETRGWRGGGLVQNVLKAVFFSVISTLRCCQMFEMFSREFKSGSSSSLSSNETVRFQNNHKNKTKNRNQFLIIPFWEIACSIKIHHLQEKSDFSAFLSFILLSQHF